MSLLDTEQRVRVVLSHLGEGQTISTAGLAGRVLGLVEGDWLKRGPMVEERQELFRILAKLAEGPLKGATTRGEPKRVLRYSRLVMQRPVLWHHCEPLPVCPHCGQVIRSKEDVC